jgi:cytoskeletal protein RodZ
MAILKKKKSLKVEIDLTGKQGNAFYLLGLASKYAKQLDLNPSEVIAEMQSSDYENLIEVFDNYFGDFVNLYR